jgi:hypothetical protein
MQDVRFLATALPSFSPVLHPSTHTSARWPAGQVCSQALCHGWTFCQHMASHEIKVSRLLTSFVADSRSLVDQGGPRTRSNCPDSASLFGQPSVGQTEIRRSDVETTSVFSAPCIKRKLPCCSKPKERRRRRKVHHHNVSRSNLPRLRFAFPLGSNYVGSTG